MMVYENIQEFSARLRKARKDAGLSQQELAERIHVGREVVVRMERGENVGFHHVMAAAAAVGRKVGLDEPGHVVPGKFDEFYAANFRKPLEVEMRVANKKPNSAGFVKISDRDRIKVVSWNQAANI